MKRAAFIGIFATLLSLCLTIAPMAASAQCVMCKSQVESARQESDDYDVTGLNKGILYMMSIPYVLMGAIGYFWYRRTHPKPARS